MSRLVILWTTLFLLLSMLFLVRYHIVGQAIYGDGIYYWAYTRSLIIDHDLDLRNEGAHTYGPRTNNSFSPGPQGSDTTDLSKNKYYPLGPTLLWSPFFIVAHLLVLLAIATGAPVPTNGYADLYQITVGLINIGFVVVGLVLLNTLLRKYFSPFTSLTTSLLVLFTTNLFYYGSLDVLNSHPSSFLLATLFSYCFVVYREKMNTKQWLSLGILLGVMTIIRLQDSIFILMPLSLFLRQLNVSKRNKKFDSFVNFFAFLVGSFVGFLPQLIASAIIYKSFFLIPYTLGSDELNFLDNKLLHLFLDSQKGLFWYSPVFITGLIGLRLLKGKLAQVRLPFFSAILTSLFLVGAWSGWSQGESYGMRMFISLLPLLSFGIAEMVTFVSRYLSKPTIIIIGLLFVLQNLVLITAFHLFFHNPTYVGDELSQSGKLKTEILHHLQRLK